MPAVVAAYLLALWTLLTWGTRIRNAAQDDEAALAYAVPVLLVVIAVATLVQPRRWTRLLGLTASLAWLVRVPIILAADHGAGFKVVHTALAVITWVLAVLALRAEARRRAPA